MHNGCILDGEMGTGKSRTAAAYYYDNEAPKPVYVITTAKKRDTLDWEIEFGKYGVGTNQSVEGLLTVDSWNNLRKYEEVKGAFFILDEQRLVGSGAWTKSFLRIAKQNTWILLSGTPGDSWMDYVPVFVANGFYKNRAEFIREHVVYSPYTKFPKIQRFLGERKLIELRKQVLVTMELDSRNTKKEVHEVECEFDCELFDKVWKRRWNIYENRPLRDVSEMYRVGRRLVNSDPSRFDACRRILKKKQRLVIFYNFNYELEILRGLSKYAEVAEWNGHKHEPIPTGDRWVYLVQYIAGSEGWDCTSTGSMILYSMPYSYKLWRQAFGRIDRLDTLYEVLDYYVLKTDSRVDKEIGFSLKKKKNFNEKRYSWRN